MTTNTLTGLIPTLYEALDIISRELVGFIPAVSRDSSAARAAKDQTVRSHIVPAVTLESIVPGNSPADSGDAIMDYVDLSISRSEVAPVRWTGEEQMSVSQSLQAIQRDRFAQSMRALVNAVEADVGGLYLGACRAYGTAGTAPFGSNVSILADVLKILKDNGAPDTDLQCVFDTSAGANLRSLTQLTDVNRSGADRTLRDGILGDLFKFQLRESGGIQTQDNSTEDDSGTVVVDGDHVKGATTISLGVTVAEGTFLAGNFLTIGDYDYMIVTGAVVASGASGDVVIAEPGLRTVVADTTAVTQNTTDFAANMAFQRSALHLVTRTPAMPEGGDKADDVIEIVDPLSGLAFQVAMYRQYRRVKYEVGLAWGFKLIKPEHAVVLLG